MRIDGEIIGAEESMPEAGISEVTVRKVSDSGFVAQRDQLAVEEPLEIRLGFIEGGRRRRRSVSVTMRTPGDDFELAAGFLLTEGIIERAADIERIFHSGAPLDTSSTKGTRNTVNVDLRAGLAVNLRRLERRFYTTSSCGVCGKTSIDALRVARCANIEERGVEFDAAVIHRLPDVLREAQLVFGSTGGLHAAALFDMRGQLRTLREDVGRHNAVDKLIGSELLAGRVPLSESLIFVSGRTSFELVQKAVVAGAPVLAAVGAPSSLAVELAREFGVTLLGFVRDRRFNIYAGEWRIREAGGEPPGKLFTEVEVI